MKALFVYAGIRVRDLDESIDFYTSIFGLKLLRRFKIESTKGEVAELTDGSDFFIELNHYQPDSPFYTEYTVGEALDHLAFKVEKLDEALSEAREKGIEVVQEMKTESSRWAYIKDPNGIWIELFE